jgi:predicted nuclease of restriction endonuclease-like RecB superfamily
LLTVDLVRVRRKGEQIHPVYIRGPAVARLLPVAQAYVETHVQAVGRSRDDIDAMLGTIEVPARDRVAALGLRKVVEDRCEYQIAAGADPETLRADLFWAAAKAHRALDVRAELDRAAVMAESAARLGITPEALDAGLYADLRGSEILERVEPLTPEAAVERYNLGLAQAVLLRALRVTVKVEGEGPGPTRRLFRAARFHQLIHVVTGDSKSGYTIQLDGPFSLFDSVQRYGLRLALFLPSVLAFRSFQVRADVLWGKERAPAVFEITPGDELVPHFGEAPEASAEIDTFCAAFGRLESEWTVKKSERLFALPGEVVCVPDLVFANKDTGEQVYLEVFGFWSRAAVWQRVELLRKGNFPGRILLAVGKQLRVSKDVLGEDDPGEIYVYKATMSPRAILERLRGEKRAAKAP